MKKPIIIAHRGASAYAPENTMAAFKKALEMGSGGIEIDVHLSADGYPVVIHDNRLERTSNGTGLVKDKSLNELKGLDFGSWFSEEFKNEPIPTLEEVFDLISNISILLNIEIKSGGIVYLGIEEIIAGLVKKYRMEEKVIISSFNHHSLSMLKRAAPEIKIGLLYSESLEKPWEHAKKLGAEAIHPSYTSISPEVVKASNENGVLVNPYPIDNPEHIRLAIQAGVDGIITNVPDVAVRILEEMSELA